MTSDAVRTLLTEAVGADALEVGSAAPPWVRPGSTDAVAAVVRLAREHHWRLAVAGAGSWLAPDAPADVVVSTTKLTTISRIAASDLVATVAPGIGIGDLAARLRAEAVWLAVDPPGGPARTLGSIVATGTAGPLRHRFGPIRDQIIGCTFVTGEGNVVKAGGTVVKNVAGYDLTKLQVGGFGGFGILTEINLRLRVAPATDRTLVARAARDPLTRAARGLVETNLDAAALELSSPAVAGESTWVLAVRLLGTEAGVAAEEARLATQRDVRWDRLDPTAASAWWAERGRAIADGPVSIRLGVLPDGLDDTLDLLGQQLDLERVSAGPGRGGLRWTGAATPERLRSLRTILAQREIPLTVERAPWAVRHAVGHFGAYREGVAQLTARLRTTLDPAGLFVVALDSGHDA